tara:strand:+ start:921 stop:1394 length:474 start_codon:yes stop_codon:yes gene_type:complete
MPLYNFSQLVGKTFVLKNDTPFYRINDINNLGDNAKPVNKLKANYSFVLDSYLSPTDGGTNPIYPSIKYAKRSYYFFTFYGNDGKYYGVIYDPIKKQFNTDVLRQQGAKTIEQQIREKEELNKSFLEKLLPSVKKALFIGIGIFAIVQILPILIKKK